MLGLLRVAFVQSQSHAAAVAVFPGGVIHDLLYEMDAQSAGSYIIQIPRAYGVEIDLPATVLDDELQQSFITCFGDGQRDGAVWIRVVAMPDDVAERFIHREAYPTGLRGVEAQSAAKRINHLPDSGQSVGAAVELHPEIMRGLSA